MALQLPIYSLNGRHTTELGNRHQDTYFAEVFSKQDSTKWKKQKRTINVSCDGALLELHDVLSQSPRFVWEDVLNLAQLLIQGGGSSLQSGA